MGAILIGGPIAAALGLSGAAGLAASGAATGILAGGLVGGLSSLGVPEERARMYEEDIRRGGVLLAVPADERADVDMIQGIFDRHQATQVETVGELRRGERM